jgi:hypothetical protein
MVPGAWRGNGGGGVGGDDGGGAAAAGTPDPTRPDPTRPDLTRPDPTRPDSIRPGTSGALSRAGAMRESAMGVLTRPLRTVVRSRHAFVFEVEEVKLDVVYLEMVGEFACATTLARCQT